MNQPTTCLAIEISSERVKKIIDSLNDSAPLDLYNKEWRYETELVHTHHNSQTQALLNRMVQIYTENHQDRSFMIDLAVSELIVRLLRHNTRAFIMSHSCLLPDHNGLNAAIAYIQKNLNEPLCIDRLCKLACMSRTKFFAEFKQKLACTPKDFLYQLRLKQAAKMLKHGSTITRACFASGFSNNSHFSRCFKAFYGMTPSQYKHRHLV
jgi:transcriptional regulator GlxA family with amidase domain